MSMDRRAFGSLPDGRQAELCRITGPAGETAEISTLGAALVSLWMPDRAGRLEDVVLGFDRAEEYLTRPGCYGLSIGRFANRIANGRFPLEGELIQLAVNRPPHTIHGGPEGFHTRLWDVAEQTGNAVSLTLFSPDGDQGFPGNFTVTARFALEQPGVLTLTYTVRSDETTVCSMTNHAYWNLAGHTAGAEAVARHRLWVEADQRLETDETGVPTGKLLDVAGVFDLRQGRPLGDIFAEIGSEPEITRALGFDHPYLLRGNGFRKAARAEEPVSGRSLEVWTDLPAVQVYTAGNREPDTMGKDGAPYGPHTGFCLETEECPDAPNHPNFPSALLRAGEEKCCRTEFRFGIYE